MELDKEPSVNTKHPSRPSTVKARTVQLAHEGGKMGWNVPPSTVEFFKDIRRPMIRSTALQVLDECPRKFLYESKLGIRSKDYQAPLTMGTIVHKVLESLFLGQTEAESQEVAKSILSKEQQKLMGAASPAGFLPSGKSLESVLKSLEEDYHKARAIALVFWDFVPFDPNKYEVLRNPDGVPMVEVILECNYPGISRTIRGPCDLALVEKETGEVWIVDYKTTSMDPKIRAIPTKISVQLSLYRLLLQSHIDAWAEAGIAPERKVVGSIHAIIKKPGIKYCPDTKDKEGFHSYIQRLVKWYSDYDEKNPKSPAMILDPNRFSTKLMTQELFGRLKQFCKASYASPNIDHFYRAGGSACLSFNRVCPYIALCNSDPAMWPDLIDSRYTLGFREDEENNDD